MTSTFISKDGTKHIVHWRSAPTKNKPHTLLENGKVYNRPRATAMFYKHSMDVGTKKSEALRFGTSFPFEDSGSPITDIEDAWKMQEEYLQTSTGLNHNERQCFVLDFDEVYYPVLDAKIAAVKFWLPIYGIVYSKRGAHAQVFVVLTEPIRNDTKYNTVRKKLFEAAQSDIRNTNWRCKNPYMNERVQLYEGYHPVEITNARITPEKLFDILNIKHAREDEKEELEKIKKREWNKLNGVRAVQKHGKIKVIETKPNASFPDVPFPDVPELLPKVTKQAAQPQVTLSQSEKRFRNWCAKRDAAEKLQDEKLGQKRLDFDKEPLNLYKAMSKCSSIITENDMKLHLCSPELRDGNISRNCTTMKVGWRFARTINDEEELTQALIERNKFICNELGMPPSPVCEMQAMARKLLAYKAEGRLGNFNPFDDKGRKIAIYMKDALRKMRQKKLNLYALEINNLEKKARTRLLKDKARELFQISSNDTINKYCRTALDSINIIPPPPSPSLCEVNNNINNNISKKYTEMNHELDLFSDSTGPPI